MIQKIPKKIKIKMEIPEKDLSHLYNRMAYYFFLLKLPFLDGDRRIVFLMVLGAN